MKNTEKNREVLNKMVKACEGTNYVIRIGQYGTDENSVIYPCISTLRDAPRYAAPTIYMDEDICEEKDNISIRVQTTSYGSMSPSEIMQVAQGLMDAANLVTKLALIAYNGGIKVNS